MRFDHLKPRSTDLEVQAIGDELLVYDRRSDVAHCLTPVAARTWQALGDDPAMREVERKFGVDAVEGTISELGAKGLIDEVAADPSLAPRLSRRQAVKRLAATAVAGTAIVSVAAPTAAWAASCNAASGRDAGCACTLDTQCASGKCLGTLTCKA